ncbi:adenylate/guanylate cyclase domain-containing protein [Pseudanabaena sp. FACHB-1998]|uniref:adenylate/guanylate cyclase domain-containing protein n=1 Tax=Pseudanabaena sp. FACHB-1998 TaxID=2692858 RepID=UPI0016817517|nr:adenylate/guanylate cyclase domain-containing protein [Pseudanabaena sp. FACHB-1998]MBD2177958.1 adenylate/guanylate cyclase domain-containing protein [Pseudanabaena sp. FACHB-1998]
MKAKITNKLKALSSPKFIGYALVGLIAGLGAIATGFELNEVQSLERQTQSAFFNWRGTIAPPKDIVILAIDDISLRQGEFYDPKVRPFLEPFRTTTWKRVVYAQVLEKLVKAGAKVVAFDILFVTPGDHGKEDDDKFQKAITKYGDRAVFAASYEVTQIGEASILQLASPESIFKIKPNTLGLINFKAEVTTNIHRLGVQPPADSGLPNVPTFASSILNVAKISYPQPKGDGIYFFGGVDTWTNAQQQIPFYYVVDPENWKSEQLQNGKFFKDKIVLIGATAASKQDIQNSAMGRMSGIEIHANAIATLMQGKSMFALFPNPVHSGLFIFLLVGISGTLLCLLKRPNIQILASLGIAIAWFGIGYASFVYGSAILPVAIPAIAISLNGVALLTTGSIAAQIDKLLLRRTLERYVAAPIVEEIVNQPEGFRDLLEGRTIKAAVLFSDIRGFTTLSSRLPAKVLIQQLNTYLGGMVDAILEYQGTIDKFIGDAIMAEFGSPVSRGEKADAMNAVNAALNMRAALMELRKVWQSEKKIPFSNGIGINYGEVTVGNIGSARRLEYAVIGDTVNVASRVEGMTKDLGTDIVITGNLYEIVKDEIDVVDFGEHALKGRVGKVRLYGVIGLKGCDRQVYEQVQTDLKRHTAVIDILKKGQIPSL